MKIGSLSLRVPSLLQVILGVAGAAALVLAGVAKAFFFTTTTFVWKAILFVFPVGLGLVLIAAAVALSFQPVRLFCDSLPARVTAWLWPALGFLAGWVILGFSLSAHTMLRENIPAFITVQILGSLLGLTLLGQLVVLRGQLFIEAAARLKNAWRWAVPLLLMIIGIDLVGFSLAGDRFFKRVDAEFGLLQMMPYLLGLFLLGLGLVAAAPHLREGLFATGTVNRAIVWPVRGLLVTVGFFLVAVSLLGEQVGPSTAAGFGYGQVACLLAGEMVIAFVWYLSPKKD